MGETDSSLQAWVRPQSTHTPRACAPRAPAPERRPQGSRANELQASRLGVRSASTYPSRHTRPRTTCDPATEEDKARDLNPLYGRVAVPSGWGLAPGLISGSPHKLLI